MTAQEARDFVKKNNAKLQRMYDVAPFAEEDPNPDAKPVAQGLAAFRKYIDKKGKAVKNNVLQT